MKPRISTKNVTLKRHYCIFKNYKTFKNIFTFFPVKVPGNISIVSGQDILSSRNNVSRCEHVHTQNLQTFCTICFQFVLLQSSLVNKERNGIINVTDARSKHVLRACAWQGRIRGDKPQNFQPLFSRGGKVKYLILKGEIKLSIAA